MRGDPDYGLTCRGYWLENISLRARIVGLRLIGVNLTYNAQPVEVPRAARSSWSPIGQLGGYHCAQDHARSWLARLLAPSPEDRPRPDHDVQCLPRGDSVPPPSLPSHASSGPPSRYGAAISNASSARGPVTKALFPPGPGSR
jgi:hypothetical protein